MLYFLIIISTLLSCYLFEGTQFHVQINSLSDSYLQTYKLLKAKAKTELIIVRSVEQLKIILLLFLKTIYILLPFLAFGIYLYAKHLNLSFLVTDLNAGLAAIFAGGSYFLIKRYVFK